MIHYYYTQINKLTEIQSPRAGCWISMIAPSEEEIICTAKTYGLNEKMLFQALEAGEHSKIHTEKDLTLVQINIPVKSEREEMTVYDTIPLTFFVLDDCIITICKKRNSIIDTFTTGRIESFQTIMKTRFLLHFFYQIASVYIKDLRNIDKQSDLLEGRIHENVNKHDLNLLTKLKKSLSVLSNALWSNEVMLEKLMKTDSFKKYHDDAELLEDVMIENKKAMEMAGIYNKFLSGVRNVFITGMNKHINTIVRVVTGLIVIIAIPTMIYSVFQINNNVGVASYMQGAYGVPMIIGLVFSISIMVYLLYTRVKYYKDNL